MGVSAAQQHQIALKVHSAFTNRDYIGIMWGDDQFRRLNSKIDTLTGLVRRLLAQDERFQMATQATLDRLNAAVAADTNAVSAASKALTGFIATVADLTAQLQAAIAAGDDAAVAAAATALEANNAALTAATPATAAAVAANLRK